MAEAKFLRSLDCPYLLRCHEVAATDDWLILVLEYLPGGEIMDHLHTITRYTEAEAAKLFAQVISAVAYMHSLNILHRDIKPENVMFTSPVEECEAQGRPLRVKLIDLGMAALYNPKKPLVGCIGTPGFVPPELWHNAPHTPAGDVYALGVVLFIMLTGRKPHSGADIRLMAYCNKSIRDAPGLRDERFLPLSPSARELLLAMLADDPRVRPTCAEVLRHPFITAVDSNAEAHREMEESVRRKIRELAMLRRVHGLRYALRVQKPAGAGHLAFLQLLDQRRLKLKGESGAFGRASNSTGGPNGGFGKSSYADAAVNPFGRPSYADSCSNGGGGTGGTGGVPAFARSSLAVSYATPPPVLIMVPDRCPLVSSTPPASASRTKTAAATAIEIRSSVSSYGTVNAAAANSLAPSPGPGTSLAPTFARRSYGPYVRGGFGGGGGNGGGSGRNSAHQSRCYTPDTRSCDMGMPVPDNLAARRPSSAAAVTNALPTLKQCQSADAVTFARQSVTAIAALRQGGVGGDGEKLSAPPPGGDSPVATAALVEKALMTRCMSVNPDTLELMRHQDSIKWLLQEAARETEPEDRIQLSASVNRYYCPPPQPREAG